MNIPVIKNTAIKNLLLWCLLMAGLSACSVMPEQDSHPDLERLQHWQIQGKLSVRTSRDNITGYLTWAQELDHFDLFISGPFGRGASRLSGDDQSASLLLPDWDQPQQAASPEELMQQHLGWQFPVRDIRYWVKGQPSPGSEHKSHYGQYGMLETLEQHGWNISFSRYQQQNGYWLPGLIRMKGYNYQLTLAINEWTVHD